MVLTQRVHIEPSIYLSSGLPRNRVCQKKGYVADPGHQVDCYLQEFELFDGIPYWSRSAIPCDRRQNCKLDAPRPCRFMRIVFVPTRIRVAAIKIAGRMHQHLVIVC